MEVTGHALASKAAFCITALPAKAAKLSQDIKALFLRFSLENRDIYHNTTYFSSNFIDPGTYFFVYSLNHQNSFCLIQN